MPGREGIDVGISQVIKRIEVGFFFFFVSDGRGMWLRLRGKESQKKVKQTFPSGRDQQSSITTVKYNLSHVLSKIKTGT